MEAKVKEILEFWFGPLNEEPSESTKQSWWKKDPSFDKTIRDRFEADMLKADRGEYASWESSALGSLALILLYDQFSRNVYRGTSGMYQFDQKSLALSKRLVEEGLDQTLRPIERVFSYMPLEHAEDTESQALCLTLFAKLKEEAVTDEDVKMYGLYHEFAVKHSDVVEEFGRFPHRNEILGRDSTEEELVYLSKPGAGF